MSCREKKQEKHGHSRLGCCIEANVSIGCVASSPSKGDSFQSHIVYGYQNDCGFFLETINSIFISLALHYHPQTYQ